MNGPTLSVTGNGIVATDPQIRQSGARTYAKVELAELPIVESQTKKRGWVRVELLLPKGVQAPPKGTPITILSATYEVSLVDDPAGGEPKRFFNIHVHSWRVLKTRASSAADTVAEPVRETPAPAPTATPSLPAKAVAKTIPPPEDDEDIPF